MVNSPLKLSMLKSGPKKVFPTSLVVVCGVPYECGVGMPFPLMTSASSCGVTTVGSSSVHKKYKKINFNHSSWLDNLQWRRDSADDFANIMSR